MGSIDAEGEGSTAMSNDAVPINETKESGSHNNHGTAYDINTRIPTNESKLVGVEVTNANGPCTAVTSEARRAGFITTANGERAVVFPETKVTGDVKVTESVSKTGGGVAEEVIKTHGTLAIT